MTDRSRYWPSIALWGSLTLLWLTVIYWRFAAWVDTYQNLNH